MKTKHNKHMTDCIGAVYTENNVKLLWSIRPSAIYGENKRE